MELTISNNTVTIIDNSGNTNSVDLRLLNFKDYITEYSIDYLILVFNVTTHSTYKIELNTSTKLNGVNFVDLDSFKILVDAAIVSAGLIQTANVADYSITEQKLSLAVQTKINSGKIAGIITTTLPSTGIVTDKVYEFAGTNGGTVTGGTIKDTNGSTITTLQSGDSVWYNTTTTFWYRIPFQAIPTSKAIDTFAITETGAELLALNNAGTLQQDYNSLFSSSVNLFHKKVIAGRGITFATGANSAWVSPYVASYFIPVNSSTLYSFNFKGHIHYYTSSLVWISASNGFALTPNYELTTPVNCKYIRVVLDSTVEFYYAMIVKGGIAAMPSIYVPFTQKIDASKIIKSDGKTIDNNLFDLTKANSKVTVLEGAVNTAASRFSLLTGNMLSGEIEIELTDTVDIHTAGTSTLFWLMGTKPTYAMKARIVAGGNTVGTYSNTYNTKIEFFMNNTLMTSGTINENMWGADLFSIRVKGTTVSFAETSPYAMTVLTEIESDYRDVCLTINDTGLYIYRDSVGIGTPIYSYIFASNPTKYVEDMVIDMKANLSGTYFEVLSNNGKLVPFANLERCPKIKLATQANILEFFDADSAVGAAYWDSYPTVIKTNSIGFKHKLKVTWDSVGTTGKNYQIYFDNIKIGDSIASVAFSAYNFHDTILYVGGETSAAGYKGIFNSVKFNNFYNPNYIVIAEYNHVLIDSDTEVTNTDGIYITGKLSFARLERTAKYLKSKGWSFVNQSEIHKIKNGLLPLTKNVFSVNFDDWSYNLFINTRKRNIFNKYDIKPTLMGLVSTDGYFAGTGGTNSEPLTVAGINTVLRNNWNIGYHGMQVSQYKIGVAGYEQYIKFLQIGKDIMLALEYDTNTYAVHASSIMSHQVNVVKSMGFEHVVGNDSSVNTLNTFYRTTYNFNIPDAFYIAGDVSKLNVITKRGAELNWDVKTPGGTDVDAQWTALKLFIDTLY